MTKSVSRISDGIKVDAMYSNIWIYRYKLIKYRFCRIQAAQLYISVIIMQNKTNTYLICEGTGKVQ